MREVDPTRFGHIPGVPLFTTWPSRKACSDSGVHVGIIAGIYGSKVHGAYSIALSGQYNDDDDQGETFMYTGTGGREKVTNTGKQTKYGRQIEDQSFEHSHNKALLISYTNGSPVRVIRGSKCNSKYAPPEGYRYDGLYVIDDVKLEMGINGFKVCRFAFRRLPNQGNIPVRAYALTLANMKKTKRTQAVSETESDGDLDLATNSPPPSRSSSPPISPSEPVPVRSAPTRSTGRGRGTTQGGTLARMRKSLGGRRALDLGRLNHTRALQGAQPSSSTAPYGQ
ncbi:hypothetical protein QCA50_006307 [Cerrena zonata]|uniref:YDG domain-containing protein n=1 Tax=Cerrena zonata TaxID=2478898 RepID=A0AAW0FGG2_9APHY